MGFMMDEQGFKMPSEAYEEGFLLVFTMVYYGLLDGFIAFHEAIFGA